MCHVCEKVHADTLVVCGIAAAVASFVFALVLGWIHLPYFGEGSIFVRFLKSIDSGSLKVCWVTYQIVISCSWSLDIRYPFPFSQFLGLLSFFTLDFLAVECFQEGDVATRYFTTVYLWSTIPIVLALALVLSCAARILLLLLGAHHDFGSTRGGSKSKRIQDIKNQHVWLLLLLSYMTLPPVAMKQFQSLDCIPFGHDGSRYLRVDTAIDCNSADYQRFLGICACFIAVYQFVPVICMLLLWRLRFDLKPPTSSLD